VCAQGDPFLGDCTGLEFLVIDEADRMVETGHFRELKSIITLIQHPASRELIVLPSTPVPSQPNHTHRTHRTHRTHGSCV
jgi:superfamily II DNA/RNA helicase